MLITLAVASSVIPMAPTTTPTIFWANTPVGPNQTVVLAGGHFPAAPVVELSTASSNNRTLAPLQVTDASIMFTLPADVELSAYQARVCGKVCSNWLSINVAELWWVAGDRGNSSTAGGWIRLFGTALDFSGFGSSAHGQIALLEERLQHALRCRDYPAVTALANELSKLGGTNRAAGAELQLTRVGDPAAAPVVLPALNASLWDATFPVPKDLPPGTYTVSARNSFQSDWSRLDSFGGSWNPHISTIDVGVPQPPKRVFAVVDYLKQFGIPPGGMNYCMHRRVQTCDFLAPQSADRAFEPRCEQRLALV